MSHVNGHKFYYFKWESNHIGLSWKLNTILAKLANGWLNGEVLVQDSLSTCVVYPKINKKYNSFHPYPTADRSNQFGMTHIFLSH